VYIVCDIVEQSTPLQDTRDIFMGRRLYHRMGDYFTWGRIVFPPIG